MAATPTETALREAVEAMLDENPTRVLPVVAEALRSRGARCLAAVVNLGDGLYPPQVTMTMSIDDVTFETVKHVVAPVLRKAGLPADVVPIMAGAAGSAATRWLAVQRQQRERQAAAVAAPGPAPESPATKSAAWQPGPPRR